MPSVPLSAALGHAKGLFTEWYTVKGEAVGNNNQIVISFFDRGQVDWTIGVRARSNPV